MKSLYFKTKTRFTPSELKAYLSEDNTDNLPLYIKPETNEVDEVSSDFDRFNEWLSNQKVTRKLKYLVIHCTATDQSAKVSSITNYWKNNLGWKSPGYHIIIKSSGEYTVLQELQDSTNGVKGYNHNSIHVSYIGGVNSKGKAIDNRTQEQIKTMEHIVNAIQDKYNLELMGHRDFPRVAKDCPSFDAKTETIKNK